MPILEGNSSNNDHSDSEIETCLSTPPEEDYNDTKISNVSQSVSSDNRLSQLKTDSIDNNNDNNGENVEDLVARTPRTEDDDSSDQDDASASISSSKTTKTTMSWDEKWSLFIFDRIHKPIIRVLQVIAGVSARNPIRTIAIISIFSLGLLAIGFFTNFKLDVDETTLWTPVNSYAMKHSKWIQEESGFPIAPRPFFLFFHADGASVLGREQINHVFNVTDTIMTRDGYNDVCNDGQADITLPNGTQITTCAISGVMRFWEFSSLQYTWSVSSDEEAIEDMSARFFPDGGPVDENAIFGNPVRDESGLLTSAQGYTVVFSLPETQKAIDWELDALDAILAIDKEWEKDPLRFNGMRLTAFAEGSFKVEFTRGILQDLPLVPVAFFLMLGFSCMYFSRKNRVQSRSLLGLGAVIAVLLSIMAGYGLLFTIGTPFTPMTQIVPFIILGIGLDDAFIIIGSFLRTKASKSIEDRIQDTIQDAGFSITLTTATSAIAFALGCGSSIPAVDWLCLYTFPTIAIVFFYQVTFFVACIVLDERRVQQRRRGCCVCFTVEDDRNDRMSFYEYGESPIDQGNFVTKFMAWYAEHLLKPKVKVLVVVVFTAFTCLSAWSASQFEQNFNAADVLPSDSYILDALDAVSSYRSESGYQPGVYFRNEDFSDESVLDSMEKYVDDLVAMKNVEEEPTFFWLRDFRKFENSTNFTTFNEKLDAFLSDPVYYDLYWLDIVRDSNGTMTASRTFIKMNNEAGIGVKDKVEALEDQLEVTLDQEINNGKEDFSFFTYVEAYNAWEFYTVSVIELIYSTIVGIVCVTIIALVMIPHWSAALFVLPIVCVMYVDILGLMQWAGININAVSYVTLVMSIGLIVDFIMHVLLRYFESPGNRREKTVETLRTMGASVLAGGISTFLGTLPLALTSSDIIYTVFVAFFSLVMVGVSHGLILLPVLVATFGPEHGLVMHTMNDAEGKDSDECFPKVVGPTRRFSF